MTKVSDYTIDFLNRYGISDVFTVTGGGIMHLIDSLGRHPGMRYICNYHEQACAIAAEAYARTKNGIGACLVTTGPGSANALSGIAGAWVDSIPVLIISGQVRRDLIADYSIVRQVGPQEINIDAMARPVTKYFTTLMDPSRIRYELERAMSIATSGRPGPVWINIPLDVQGATIDESALPRFEVSTNGEADYLTRLTDQARTVSHLLQEARRPLLIAGNGVNLARAGRAFRDFVARLDIPVSLTLGGMDLLGESHPCFVGRFGPIGQRRANFAVQNADLILGLGTSLSLSTIGFNTEAFAPQARKIMVNVDCHEIGKTRPVPDLGIATDVGAFLDAMLALPKPDWGSALDPWRSACSHWRNQYPPLTDDYFADKEHVNSYVFADALSRLLGSDDLVLTGNSLDAWSIYQTYKVREGQRVFTNINFGAMGWDLPAVVGACTARGGKRTVLVTGDGSFQFNIQELQTIRHNRLDVKVFVFNNSGYASIRSTQDTHFGGHLVGSDANSGISNPSFEAIASAYAMRYVHIRDNDGLEGSIRTILDAKDAVLCEVNIAYGQGRTPRVMSRRRDDGTMESGSMENMYPFLPPEEVRRNMQMFDTVVSR